MERRELVTGRASSPTARKRKRFSESALFTLGLAFIIVYFAGLTLSAGEPEARGADGAVAVMAEQEDAPEEKGIWDLLEDGLREAFKGGR